MKRIFSMLTSCLALFSVSPAHAENARPAGRINENAQDLLEQGIAYLQEAGTEQDYRKAMQLFLKAAEMGNKKAPRYAGLLYEQGLGVEQNAETAAFWYEKGVQAGDLTSGYYLGLLYRDGKGVPQDAEKAAALFSAVEQSDNKSATGVVDAGYELAVLYETGIGVVQDMEKAIALYREAAQYGQAAANAALKRLNIPAEEQ